MRRGGILMPVAGDRHGIFNVLIYRSILHHIILHVIIRRIKRGYRAYRALLGAIRSEQLHFTKRRKNRR